MPPEQTPDAYDEFSNIFASLTDKGENTDETNSATDQAASAAGAADDAQQQTQQADGAGDSGESTETGTDPAAADGTGSQDNQGGNAAGGDQGASDVDWQAKFAALESQFDAFKAGTQQAAAPTQQGQAPATQDQPPAIYSAEEQAELAELQKDWPDLHRLFSLMARQLQVDTLKYAFSEVGKVIQPLQESVSTYSTNDHMAAIYDAHSDYDQVYQPVMEWIEQQPSFLKAAYQNVVKQGTADDVSTMIQRFKDETKWVAPTQGAQGAGGTRPATPAAAASASPQQQTGLSEAAKKAAKAMGAVGTKRSAAANAQDPNDFDGAWAEAVGS